MRAVLASALMTGLLLCGRGMEARSGPTPHLPEGTPVVVVGQISSPPKGTLNEQKMQIAVGRSRTDYTLHFGDAYVLKGPNGEKVDEDGFDDGQWVRAEGRVMDDPRRVMVSRIRIITSRKLANLRGNPYNRSGHAYGYIMWPAGEARVAGYRRVYRASD